MRKLTTFAVLVGILAAALGAAASEGSDADTGVPVVRPGMAWTRTGGENSPQGHCTLAFLFRAGDDTYAATAAHCLPGGPAGEREAVFAEEQRPVIYLRGLFMTAGERGPRIGVGIYRGNRWPESFLYGDDDPNLPIPMDFGLILLDRNVPYDPEMCFFGGPTGINRDVTLVPTLAHWYGTGLVLGYEHYSGTAVLPGRSAPVILATPTMALHALPVSSGDSGSPLIDAEGRAVAMLSSPESSARLGPSLDRVEKVLGLGLQLLTAPLTGSPVAGADPACALWTGDGAS